ncbi:MAG: hypothetical protein Q4C79_07970 [Neisseria sp.]|uniref:DNA modification system-associated small protein n=1 Tax=Neisseria sp. TaxID=192066 RepID=UPI0026DD55BF|nr:DNA modification system-associated small protein [Neisseria sp.]MDO4248874.1 hypothetical protein [Neisseria sp.]
MTPETQEQISDLLLWSDKESHEILKKVATEHGIEIDALADLVAWEREELESIRRRQMNATFDEIFDNEHYWRK